MHRFSKLKKRIESLFSPDLNLQVHCTVYYWKGLSSNGDIFTSPRLWIALDKEIIFDFPKDHEDVRIPHPMHPSIKNPVFDIDIHLVTDLIHEYIETPVKKLFDHVFPNDYFGLTDILKSADRRIGIKG